MKRLTIAWMLALVGCGGPVLQNAPAPNPTHVAAAAAGAATALTLADPDAATRKPEQNRQDAESETQEIEVEPSEVLDAMDRADAANQSAGRAITGQ